MCVYVRARVCDPDKGLFIYSTVSHVFFYYLLLMTTLLHPLPSLRAV